MLRQISAQSIKFCAWIAISILGTLAIAPSAFAQSSCLVWYTVSYDKPDGSYSYLYRRLREEMDPLAFELSEIAGSKPNGFGKIPNECSWNRGFRPMGTGAPWSAPDLLPTPIFGVMDYACVTAGIDRYTNYYERTYAVGSISVSDCGEFFLDPETPVKEDSTPRKCGNEAQNTQKPVVIADPINLGTGSVVKAEGDCEANGGAQSLSFRRYYDSSDPRESYEGSMGRGWRGSYSRQVYPTRELAIPRPYRTVAGGQSSKYATPAAACQQGFVEVQARTPSYAGATAVFADNVCQVTRGGTLLGTLSIFVTGGIPMSAPQPVGLNLVRDDGQILRFRNVGGTLRNPVGSNLKLQTNATGFTVVDEFDNTETYDQKGNLLSIVARSGASKTFSYNASKQLTRVTDDFGHQLNFGYTGNSITRVTHPDNTQTLYAYDALNRLFKVTHPDLTTTQYLYENAAFPFALTGELDENNSRVSSWEYDAQGRAISTYEAGGAQRVDVIYNANGTVTMTDALGAASTVTFDRKGRRVPIGISGAPCYQCPLGKAVTLNDAGWVTSRTDYNNNVTTYINDDARGLETSRTEAFGTPRARTITTQWHPTFNLPTQIDEPGRRITFTHDAKGNVLTYTVLDSATSTSRTWTYTYNSVSQVLTADGPRTDVSDVTTYTYYTCTTGAECGHVQTIKNALNQTTTFLSYNGYGQPLTIADPNGVVTTLTYDTRHRLKSRETAGEITSFEYWPTGLLKMVMLPDLSFVTYGYDAAHRLTSIQDSEGNRVVLTLDAMGNRTKTELFDPSSALTQTQNAVYNQLSQLYQIAGAANTPAVTTTFGYDANGNPTSVSAPLNRTSSTTYDELNRAASSTDPSGTTQFGYNALDQLISVTDPKNLITNYTINALGDLTQQVSPDTGTTINTYDSGGNLKTSKDARNKTTTYTYDALNRVTQAAYVDQTINYGYDNGVNGVGRLTSASDANHSLAYTYDAQGRMLTKTQVVGTISKTVSYGYSNGNLASTTTPFGAVIGYTYTQGKVTGVTVNGITVLSNALYEPFGPSSGWTWGNGTYAIRTYDTDGKVTQIDSASLATYGYDDAFRITSRTDTVAAANSWTYGYDTSDRLTTATNPSNTQDFTFDADSNRLTQTGTQNTAFTYGATNNKLTSTTGSLARAYTYDAAGNTLTGGGITYTYNNRGRMKTAKNGSASAVTYIYNALGQRVKKTGTTRYFIYDEAGHLLGEYNSSGTMVQEFVWLGDIPVAVLTPNGTGVNIFYIHTDHLNTPRKISRPSDNKLRWTWNPDPYGNGTPNQNPQALGAFTFNLRFPGQYFDAETGNHYNYFRDYDPKTGRYLESDPIGLGGGVNTYAYSLNNPVWQYDRYGLWVPPSLPQWLVDGAAGFGDTLSFGASGWLRSQMGTDYEVNRCSAAYGKGEWSGVGLSLAFGGTHLGRNALHQMGKRGLGQGIQRLFSDRRTWGSVRDTWSIAAGNGERWLAANGVSLHHWLIPQRFADIHAGFNYLPISAAFNSWMNGSTALRVAAEWGLRGSILGIYGAPISAAVNGEECECKVGGGK